MILNNFSKNIFETFNARSLSPQQVAKSFVPSEHFSSLSERNHSLIIGPRGSGKTTLLKMLQPQALDIWSHDKADYYRSKIDFIGIFIPADNAWSKQTDSLVENNINDLCKKKIKISIFTTHILYYLIKVIEYCAKDKCIDEMHINKQLSFSRQSEIEFVRGLENTWEIKTQLPSIKGLKIALTDRLNDYYKIVNQLSSKSEKKQEEWVLNTGYINMRFLNACEVAIERVHNFIDSEFRWSFLFDELEIVDKLIVNELFESLRGSSDTLLFKLSLSPFSNYIHSNFNDLNKLPNKSHDFKVIPLWYAYKRESYPFCESLVNNMLKEKGIKRKIEDIIETAFTPQNNIDGDDVVLDSKDTISHQYKRAFQSLYHKDKSFYKFLNINKIDPYNLDSVTGIDRAKFLRKVTQIVIFRDQFLKKEGKQLVFRSRVNPTIYSGIHNLFAIVEGNPRLIIGMLYPLIIDMHEKGEHMIYMNKQTAQLDAVSNTYKALLQTIPVPTYPNMKRKKGLLEIIDIIGNNFKNELYGDVFNPDIQLCFTVDDAIPSEFHESIGHALNVGAIIQKTRPQDAEILTSLNGKTFRLSYLLATEYHLPIFMPGKSKQLKNILFDKGVNINQTKLPL